MWKKYICILNTCLRRWQMWWPSPQLTLRSSFAPHSWYRILATVPGDKHGALGGWHQCNFWCYNHPFHPMMSLLWNRDDFMKNLQAQLLTRLMFADIVKFWSGVCRSWWNLLSLDVEVASVPATDSSLRLGLPRGGDLLRSVRFIMAWHFKFDFLQAWLPSIFD